MDRALAEMPNFASMNLAQARQAFYDWVDNTWDWNKKIPGFKHDVSEMRTVEQINKLAWNAALSGMKKKVQLAK